jgi:hyperosmotically inducible periplasmic protein
MITTFKAQLASVALAALLPFASSGALAQGGDTASATGSMSATGKAAKPTKAERSANHALQKKVRVALAKTRGLNVANISVRARNGAIVLEGTVPEAPQVDLATQVAQGVEGVSSVRNLLTTRQVGE